MTFAMQDDVERLMQRFLDNELTRGERRRLLELMTDHPDVRERLVTDETMLDAAASLPRPVPAADFVSRTMAQLPAQERRDGEQVMQSRAGGRWLTAAAAIVLLATGFGAGRSIAPHAPPQRGTAMPADTSAVVVRMMLMQPEAHSVVVVGDFNGWNPARSPLQKQEGGLWGTTLTLPPGRYNYMFLIDGTKWVADPLAAEVTSDGFGATNSVLDAEI